MKKLESIDQDTLNVPRSLNTRPKLQSHGTKLTAPSALRNGAATGVRHVGANLTTAVFVRRELTGQLQWSLRRYC